MILVIYMNILINKISIKCMVVFFKSCFKVDEYNKVHIIVYLFEVIYFVREFIIVHK